MNLNKFILTFSLLFGFSGTVAFGQSAIPDSLLVGFDEDAALLELKEDKVDPDMINRFLQFKREEYAGKKAGTWQVPYANPYGDNGAFGKKGNHGTPAPLAGCNNVDFENGSFSGWVGAYGSCPTYASNPCVPASNPICPLPGLVPGRHTIMSGIGFDPWVGPALPVVSSGGSYSVRLGNESVGGQAEQLSTTFTVTQSHFSYKYAVVLDDPSHSPAQQPFFKIDVIETATGNPIACAQYFVVAGAGVPGFRTMNVGFRTIRWKPWSTVTMDLSGYLGQQITIRFTTSDCGAGGHFGYAYIDCYCEDLKVIQQDTVCAGADAKLIAPDNFMTYTWEPDPGSNQIHYTSVPGTHTVTMTSFSGCITKAYHEVNTYPNPVAKFDYLGNEFDMSVQFNDLSTIEAPGVIVEWEWDFGDGEISNEQHPLHTYEEGGNYRVRLKTTSEDGCWNETFLDIQVGPFAFYAPNAFTPNGDEINDTFKPKGKGVDQYQLYIYDRWGNLIFETNDLEEHWDGTMIGSNKLAPIDVYVWKVVLIDDYEVEHEYKGHVALIL